MLIYVKPGKVFSALKFNFGPNNFKTLTTLVKIVSWTKWFLCL